ncbi:MAG: hypothetical protein NVS9B15_03350 [Acidobacteriaceae bacterium]
MKKLCAVLTLALMACGVLLFAQTRASEQQATFDHVAVQTIDLEKSAEFYETVLGLKRIASPFTDGKHIWFQMGTTQQLHFDKVEKLTPTTDDSHFALRVRDMQGLLATLKARGIAYQGYNNGPLPQTRPDGVHQIYFQDPSGNWIEVNDRKVD